MFKWKLIERACKVCKRTWRALEGSTNKHCSFRCRNPNKTSYVDFNQPDEGPAPMDMCYSASRKRRRRQVRDLTGYKTIVDPKHLLTP